MAIRLFHVDAFSRVPFGGNPAVVCLLDAWPEAAWMQAIAREMNVSETAFLTPAGEEYGLRWFTPLVEVDLCGHATLAAAHVLWETGALPPGSTARFGTRGGLLRATQDGEWIDIELPAIACQASPVDGKYLEALGIVQPVFLGLAGPRHVIQVASADIVRSLTPDFQALRRLAGRGIAVTAPGGYPYDFVSRYFAPWVGVDEDPVTGSVHCALAGFWGERLGKRQMLAWQASPRGGEIRLRLDGPRVLLGGRAVTIAAGELRA